MLRKGLCSRAQDHALSRFRLHLLLKGHVPWKKVGIVPRLLPWDPSQKYDMLSMQDSLSDSKIRVLHQVSLDSMPRVRNRSP